VAQSWADQSLSVLLIAGWIDVTVVPGMFSPEKTFWAVLRLLNEMFIPIHALTANKFYALHVGQRSRKLSSLTRTAEWVMPPSKAECRAVQMTIATVLLHSTWKFHYNQSVQFRYFRTVQQKFWLTEEILIIHQTVPMIIWIGIDPTFKVNTGCIDESIEPWYGSCSPVSKAGNSHSNIPFNPPEASCICF
jgi:hypothetical protein